MDKHFNTKTRRGRHSIGLVLLNLTGILIIVGSFYDLFVPSIPSNHLAYLGDVNGTLQQRFTALDLAMLRSIGGCLLAIGITVIVLANGPVRRDEQWSRLLVMFLVGLSEGNNAFRMYPFGSPWYGPLGFVLLAGMGVFLTGSRRVDQT